MVAKLGLVPLEPEPKLFKMVDGCLRLMPDCSADAPLIQKTVNYCQYRTRDKPPSTS